jgi:hypothetical protein
VASFTLRGDDIALSFVDGTEVVIDARDGSASPS